MTMRLTIKNEDQHRVALVRVVDQAQPPVPQQEIPPGESREFWIHHGRTLSIEEAKTE